MFDYHSDDSDCGICNQCSVGISGANSQCCCSCDYYDRKCGFDDWEYCNWVMFLGSVSNRQFNRWSDSLFKEQIQKG